MFTMVILQPYQYVIDMNFAQWSVSKNTIVVQNDQVII